MIPIADIIADQDRWDRVQYTDYPRFGTDGLKLLIRRMANIHDTQIAEGVQLLEGETDVDTPLADKKPYPGAWRVVKLEAKQLRASEAAMGIWQVLVQGDFEGAKFLSENNCSYEVYLTPLWMVEEIPVIPMNSPGITYSLTGINYDRETGTYSGFIEERHRLYQDTATFKDDRDGFYKSAVANFDDGFERKQEGVTDQAIPEMEHVAGEITNQDITLASDCTSAVNTSKRIAIEVEDADRTDEASAFETSAGRTNRNQEEPMAPAGDQVAGEIILVAASNNEFNRWDNRRTVKAAIPRESSRISYKNDFYGGDTARADRHQGAAPEDPGFTLGQVDTVSGALNEYLLYDNDYSTQRATARDGVLLTSQRDYFGSDGSVLDRNQAAAAVLPAEQTQGSIVLVSDEISPYGLHDIRTSIQAANQNLVDVSKTSTRSAFESSAGAQDKNLATAPSLPEEQEAGYIDVVSFDTNRFGLFDQNRSRKAAIPQASSRVNYRSNLYESEVSTSDRHQPAPPAAPLFVDGQISALGGDLNEYLLYDNQNSVQVAHAVTDAERTRSSDFFSTEDAVLDRNQPSAASLPAFSPGEIVVVSDARNPFNLHDIRTSTKAARTNLTATSKRSSADYFEQSDGATDRNMAAAVEPSHSLGPYNSIITVESEQNGYGLFDNQQSEIIPFRDLDETTLRTSADFFETNRSQSDMHKMVPAAASESLGAAHEIIVVTAQRDRFGLFTNETNIVTPSLDLDGTSRDSSANAFQRSDRITDRNKTVPADPSVGLGDAHEIIAISTDTTPHGLFINTRSVVTPIPAIEEGDGPVIEVDFFGVTNRISAVNQDALPDISGFEEGTLREMSGDQNEHDLYNYVTRARRSTPRLYPEAGELEVNNFNGPSYHKAGWNIPAADVQGYVDAFTALYVPQFYQIGGGVPTPNRDGTFDFVISAVPTTGGTRPPNDAQYDAIGEFVFEYMDETLKRTFRAAQLFTRDKEEAQAYALGKEASPGPVERLYDTSVKLNAWTGGESGAAWSGSKVISGAGKYSTGVDRNRGSIRWIATRVQEKDTGS